MFRQSDVQQPFDRLLQGLSNLRNKFPISFTRTEWYPL